MKDLRFAFASVVLLACGSKSESTPHATTSTSAATSPVPPASAAKCADGKITIQDSGRFDTETIVFCKANGTPAILTQGLADQSKTKKVTEITIAQWNELWQLADAANWPKLSAATLCATGENYSPRTLSIARDGKLVGADCEFGGLKPAFAVLEQKIESLVDAG